MNYSREQIEAAQTPEELTALLSARGPSPRWAVSTLTEVAEFFGVATSTVKGWRMESPPMPGSDGSWPLDAITRWRAAKITGSDLAMQQKQATLESTQLANDARRLELSKERGELVELADVELWAATAIICFRETAMSLPDSVATSCPHEIKNFVREETDRVVRGALTTLRRQLELAELGEQIATTGNVADGDDDEPTKEESTDDHDAIPCTPLSEVQEPKTFSV